ncbi:MAG: rhamnogalacturonan acetylesterase [Planctomycetales bacterium]|nr:rhamnogalacturonan acetylesterase [Planctomycetales bacterium]
MAVVSLIMGVCAACSAADDKASVTIGLIGDSTVATTYGWGPAFANRFNSQATVLNYAKNGATLDSLSDKLNALLETKPDYVLIQFGHNDMKRYDAEAYGEKLRDYVERVKRSGGKPIVLSSVTRRHFGEDGKIAPRVIGPGRSLPVFARAAEAVARETGAPFIDLHAISVEHHNKIGPEASAAYNFAESDQTHFSKAGAEAIAGLVMAELKKVAPELAEYIK